MAIVHKPKNRRLKLKPSNSFSAVRLAVFIIGFGIIGYLIFHSFAASPSATKTWDTQSDFQSGALSGVTATSDGHLTLTPESGGGSGGGSGTVTPFGSFNSGNFSDFQDSSCNSNHVSLQGGGVDGTWARFSGGSGVTCYNDNANVRVHLISFPGQQSLAGGVTQGDGPNLQTGSTFYWALSMRVPAGYTNMSYYAGAELHGDYRAQGPAPFNLGTDSGYWVMRIRGGDNTNFTQTTFGPPSQPDDNGSNRFTKAWQGASAQIVAGQWYNFLMGWHMEPDNTGWFEAWLDGPGTGGKSIQIVPRTSVATDYYNITNYPMLSLYYPVGEGSGELDYDGGAFSVDLATLEAWQNSFTNSWGLSSGGSTTYPASGTAVYSLDAGTNSNFSNLATFDSKPSGTAVSYDLRTSQDNSNWSAWVSSSNLPALPAGRYLQLRVTLATTNVAVTPSVDKISLGYSAASGSGGTSGTSPAVYNGSNLSAGQTLSGIVSWTANVSGGVASVEFWANNQRLATVSEPPYSYNLDTTKLANGTNALGLAVVGTDGSRQTPQIGQVTINNAAGAKIGDLNGDGVVNIQDLSILLSHFGGSGKGDLNGDGTIDIFDLSLMMNYFGR